MEILNSLIAPLAVALISWLIKDYIFAQQKEKRESLRSEWKYRLTNFWSPLYLWSGLILFPKHGDGENINKAVSELTAALAGNAHLLPRSHYHVIISLIEKATVLPERDLDLESVKNTRSYIYRQIEILNYLLYKRESGFDAFASSSIIDQLTAAVRLVSNTVFHLLAWGTLAAFFYSGYYFVKEGMVLWIAAYCIVILVPILIDFERRIEMRKEATDHKVVRNRFGVLAILRWIRRRCK